MRWHIIRAYTDYLETRFLQLLIMVSQITCLCSAAGRIVLRIKVNYHLFAFELRKANAFPVGRLACKSRGFTAFL